MADSAKTETIWVIYQEEGDALGWHETTFLGAAKNQEDLKHLEKRSSGGDYGYKNYCYAEVPLVGFSFREKNTQEGQK